MWRLDGFMNWLYRFESLRVCVCVYCRKILFNGFEVAYFHLHVDLLNFVQ